MKKCGERMYLNVFQKGFNYSQDGQGNRLVYHLQGCNMRCKWCANPEGMSGKGVLVTDKDWITDELCPLGAVKDKELNRQICKTCGERLCLTPKYKSKGIYFSCQAVSVDEIFAEIISSRAMFYDGGGVTFTGGEATLQFEALKELLKRLHEGGIHTAIETNGSHPKLGELFPYIDQLIMDIKHWNQEKHLEYTGISLHTVLSNVKNAIAQRKSVDIRTPIIGKMNDSEEDRSHFLQLYKELHGEGVTFELLKYHEFGRNKWEECGLTYEMTADAHVTLAQMKVFRDMIVESGLTYKNS